MNMRLNGIDFQPIDENAGIPLNTPFVINAPEKQYRGIIIGYNKEHKALLAEMDIEGRKVRWIAKFHSEPASMGYEIKED